MLTNISIIIPINTEPNIPKGIRPAPITIPADIDQNKNAISRGSFIADLNLTIDNAPTIPSDKITLEVIARIINVVIKVIATKDIPKLSEYITPLNVFL